MNNNIDLKNNLIIECQETTTEIASLWKMVYVWMHVHLRERERKPDKESEQCARGEERPERRPRDLNRQRNRGGGLDTETPTERMDGRTSELDQNTQL